MFVETGLNEIAKRVLAIVDTNKHNFPPLEFHYYKFVILLELIDGYLRASEETFQAKFFDFDNFPSLSLMRNNNDLMSLIKKQLLTKETYID